MGPVVFHGAFENAVRLGAQNAAVILEERVRKVVKKWSKRGKRRKKEGKNNKINT